MIIKTTMTILVDFLNEQRAIIRKTVNDLDDGCIGILTKRDIPALRGVLDILDTIFEAAICKGSVDPDEVADTAHDMVEGWDLEACMESAEEALIDFWSSPDGVDDYARCLEEYKE